MRIGVGALGLLLVVAGCRGGRDVPVADPGSRRTTPSGEVVGFTGRYGSYVWLGLPYAAPPVGELRWRAPRPPAAWPGVREALTAGTPCVQYASPFGVQTARTNTPVGDEDCLTLDVYAPKTATQTSFLPVMVWIHGGGNTIRAGGPADGGNLAARRDVVVVTVNYRLGPFGWFRHAALRDGAANDVERSGNFGTLDLVRALEWVQSNIAAFGGDPARVTIFGESAGATNIMTLLITPQAVGLFHRAILESGGLRIGDPERAEAFTEETGPYVRTSSNEAIARMLVASGRARDRADAKATIARTPPGELAAMMRGWSARDVLTAYEPLPGMGMIVMPVVFGDDVVIPSGPYLGRLRSADGWNRVPVMLGTNRDESKLFLFVSPQWVHRWFGIVPRLIEPDRYDVVGGTLSTMWKAIGVDEPATAMRISGATDVYAYRFDWDEEPTLLGADLSRMLGAFHGIEIPFVFGHFDLGREGNRMFTRDNEPGRTKLADAMMSYWTAFAANGRPGGGRDGTLPTWPAWDRATPSFLVLDTDGGGGIRTSTETITRFEVLDSIETDSRLATERDRCLVYHELVYGPGELPRVYYDTKCPNLPFDGFPWRK